jgi:hypothetical protein
LGVQQLFLLKNTYFSSFCSRKKLFLLSLKSSRVNCGAAWFKVSQRTPINATESEKGLQSKALLFLDLFLAEEVQNRPIVPDGSVGGRLRRGGPLEALSGGWRCLASEQISERARSRGSSTSHLAATPACA